MNRAMLLITAAVVCLTGVGNPLAESRISATLKVGDEPPAFEAKDDQGLLWRLTDHVGTRILIIYFYPADMSATAIRQATSFRDDLKELSGKPVQVVGITGQSSVRTTW